MARLRPGAPPGTLLPPESAQQRPVRLSALRYTDEAVDEREPASVEDCLALVEGPGVTWISMAGLGQPDLLARLGERLHFHPLALEDAVNVPQRSKVEAYPDHVMVILRALRLAPDLDEEQVTLFFGPNYVVSVEERADTDVFEHVRERVRRGRARMRSGGADYLAYALMDAVVDAYFPVLEQLGERLEALEDEAVARRGSPVLPRIQALRRDLVTLRRAIWPMREALAALQREQAALIAPETRVFLRDCYDHTVEALEIVETDRETAAALMEIYLATQNQRLNEVMKVLTVIATLFIPLTFIASIYGMNFEHMPELKRVWGYPATLAVMAAVAASLIYYFKRRGWW